MGLKDILKDGAKIFTAVAVVAGSSGCGDAPKRTNPEFYEAISNYMGSKSYFSDVLFKVRDVDSTSSEDYRYYSLDTWKKGDTTTTANLILRVPYDPDKDAEEVLP